ncbi:MAG: NADH-quinone oxidoreductase subunit C [Bacteroidetes bacterium]|nr:NADH-quinone oxidoreductase subunit C [Bacteroidota bacterium]MDA0874051.1 NADH-quinone oxidoreductase subunit C [Bacteroidota bacterium]
MAVADNPIKAPKTLPFSFVPQEPETAVANNPHAKASTQVADIVKALESELGDAVHETVVYAGEHTVRVARDRIEDACRFLKEALGFLYLVDIGGSDRFTEDDRYEVFYNLVNITEGKRIRLKVRVDESDMTVRTVTGVYPAANWNERECWDMFGISFEGHPDMRRMFMPEDFEYYPLRKEFPLLGVPGSLPLPPQAPTGTLTPDPFPAAHGHKPPKSFEEVKIEEDKG